MTEGSIDIRVGGGRLQTFRQGAVTLISHRGWRRQEALLIDAVPEGKGTPFLVIAGRDAVLAEIAARLNPDSTVIDWHDDVFHAERASARTATIDPEVGRRIQVVVAACLPRAPGGYGTILLPASRHGDSALTEEIVRTSAGLLAPMGRLLAAVDNRHDVFLRTRMKREFGDVSVISADDSPGLALASRCRNPVEPPVAWSKEFIVQDGETKSIFESRPGVFCHGRLDDGTRALIAEMRVVPGNRILDLGCGIGVVGIVAARRLGSGSVILADASARAVDLARANVVHNRIPDGVTIETVLTHDAGAALAPRSFDVVLANPPYYADARIAESFMASARVLLRPGGSYQVVSKLEEWHKQQLPQCFAAVEAKRRGGYGVFFAR